MNRAIALALIVSGPVLAQTSYRLESRFERFDGYRVREQRREELRSADGAIRLGRSESVDYADTVLEVDGRGRRSRIERSLEEKTIAPVGGPSISLASDAPLATLGADEERSPDYLGPIHVGGLFEDCLPDGPVAVGETWRIDGRPFAAIFWALFDEPATEGCFEGRLVEVGPEDGVEVARIAFTVRLIAEGAAAGFERTLSLEGEMTVEVESGWLVAVEAAGPMAIRLPGSEEPLEGDFSLRRRQELD